LERLSTYRRALAPAEYAALTAWVSTFYPFQVDWLLEPARFAACNKSRQIGLSHTTSGVGVLWGAFHGELTTVISIGERESAEVLDKAKKHSQVLCKLGSRMARITRGRDSATEIRFASGGRLLALPSTGGRSFTGNVFLDEYAYQERPGEVWDAAAAVTMLGGYRIRVASTPNGVGNDFHQLITDQDRNRGWALHEIPITRAIEQGYPVNLDDCWKIAKNDPRLFAQLFKCQFLDGAMQYVPTEYVNRCTTDDLYSITGQYYAGLDVGLSNDLTCLVVLAYEPAERTGDVGLAKVQLVRTCKRTDLDTLHALIDQAMGHYGIRKLAVDATGIGAFPAQELAKRWGSRVEPFTFTNQSKEGLATGLYGWTTSECLRIPATGHGMPHIEAGAPDALRADICSIRREVTAAGNIRYDAPRTDKGHADRAWALALALHAIGKRPAKMVISQNAYAV
jgi:phage FluMu gp28-like protein